MRAHQDPIIWLTAEQKRRAQQMLNALRSDTLAKVLSKRARGRKKS